MVMAKKKVVAADMNEQLCEVKLLRSDLERVKVMWL